MNLKVLWILSLAMLFVLQAICAPTTIESRGENITFSIEHVGNDVRTNNTMVTSLLGLRDLVHHEKRFFGSLFKVIKKVVKFIPKIIKGIPKVIKGIPKVIKSVPKIIKNIVGSTGKVLGVAASVLLGVSLVAPAIKGSKTGEVKYDECVMSATSVDGAFDQKYEDDLSKDWAAGMTDLERYIARQQLCTTEGLNQHEVDLFTQRLKSAPKLTFKGAFSERTIQRYIVECQKLPEADRNKFLDDMKALQASGTGISDEEINKLVEGCRVIAKRGLVELY